MNLVWEQSHTPLLLCTLTSAKQQESPIPKVGLERQIIARSAHLAIQSEIKAAARKVLYLRRGWMQCCALMGMPHGWLLAFWQKQLGFNDLWQSYLILLKGKPPFSLRFFLNSSRFHFGVTPPQTLVIFMITSRHVTSWARSEEIICCLGIRLLLETSASPGMPLSLWDLPQKELPFMPQESTKTHTLPEGLWHGWCT